ncbi:MAG: SPOR domain-containing protein [Tardiphaga sp.]
MANRYQNRSYPADAGHNDPRAQGEGDPLAELARLIGQTDPFGGAPARQATGQPQRRPEPAAAAHDDVEDQFEAAPTPPPWMQRVAAQRAQHPVEPTHHAEPEHYAPVRAEPAFDGPQADQHYADPQAYAAQGYAQQGQSAQGYAEQAYAEQGYAEQDGGGHAQQSHAGYDAYGHPQAYATDEQPLDPNRYDHALYGQPEPGQATYQQEQYQDDPYAYQQDGYAEDEPAPKRRSGMKTVAAVLALAVIGTGGAFAYRTFIGSTRGGEPPVIKADPGPNKVVPPSASAAASNDSGKQMDRLAAGQERLVSREEQPVNVQDASKAGGPRVVFPPLNQNNNPPTTASVSPANKPMVGNGAMSGDEPRRIRTLSVRGDQADATATPASRQAPARLTAPAAAPPPAVNAANAPMSLSPQSAPPPATRTAALNTAPQDLGSASSAASGGYVVQISSQRSDADARASFKALQTKFPSVLGSRSPMIKKADLGDKGTYYRAMVGPFGSSEEASQLCGNLKSAGGQCVVQRN